MTTILEALQKGAGYLEKHGIESGRLNMQHLLAHVLGCERMQLYVDFDRELPEPGLSRLRELMKQRADGVPLQHLLGTVEFHGHDFHCDERALIPRPETEYLVDWLAKRDWKPEVALLDLGCGSGVIGLSLAAALAEIRPSVTLGDISPEALSLARENADRLSPVLGDAGIRCVESDLFSALDETFDLVVANLPYVSEADMKTLSREVQHDPERALHGGHDGMEVMNRFLAEARAHLNPGGWIAMEFGLGQEAALSARARELGYSNVQLLTDLEGRNRFLLAGPESS